MAKRAARIVVDALTVVAVALLAVGTLGCGPEAATPGRCPQDIPASCPSPPPAYAADVAPVVMRRCGVCHTAGGVEETAPLDTYEQVHARRAEIQVRLQSCLMPPADQPQPTMSERAALLGWLVCGAPNN